MNIYTAQRNLEQTGRRNENFDYIFRKIIDCSQM